MTENTGFSTPIDDEVNPLYRDMVTENVCGECEIRPSIYVKPDSIELTACSSCFMDLTPREQTKYIRIDKLPARPRKSIMDMVLEDDGSDEEDEDFQLDESDDINESSVTVTSER